MTIEIIKKNVSGEKTVEVWADGEIIFPYPIAPTVSSVKLICSPNTPPSFNTFNLFNVFERNSDYLMINDERIAFEGVPKIHIDMTTQEMAEWVENIKRLRKEVAAILSKNESQSFVFEV